MLMVSIQKKYFGCINLTQYCKKLVLKYVLIIHSYNSMVMLLFAIIKGNKSKSDFTNML